MTEHSNADTREATADGDETETERPVDSVLLNAVTDVILGERNALADDASRAVVEDVLSAATTPDERDQFRTAVEQIRRGTDRGGPASGGEAAASSSSAETAAQVADPRAAVATVVDAVRAALADSGARVTVDHVVSIPVVPRETAVYDFARTREPAALDRLDLSETVASHVTDGAQLVAAGEFAAAADAFTRAVDETGSGHTAVTTRTLAAWAHHWAGDDYAAIDFVEEALHHHADAWLPTLPGYSADPDPSFARPAQFRDGKYAAMAVLRYTVDCPEGTSFTPFLGRGETPSDVTDWTELDGTDECTPIHRFGADPVLRLRLSGEVPAFPGLHSYYVGSGIVDLEVTELREVYRLLLEGPLGEEATETISVELPD